MKLGTGHVINERSLGRRSTIEGEQKQFLSSKAKVAKQIIRRLVALGETNMAFECGAIILNMAFKEPLGMEGQVAATDPRPS